ncbi:MAG: DUF309 domain-containing protein [Fidelibacterota bacterium]
MPPRKRRIAEVSRLEEPELSEEQEVLFTRGLELFNRQRYWEAHESWEDLWKTLTNGPEDDWEIVMRGLIQLAAGLHGLSLGKSTGGASNLLKARTKLEIHDGRFLGVDMDKIVATIESSVGRPQELLGYLIERSTGD